MVPVEPRDDPTVINTLGKLADAGMGLVWTCNHCHRTLGLTLDEAIRRWGRDQAFVRWTPRIICGSCGSRDISMRVQAKVPGRT
ncbi:hypothetical protein [Aurantimonas coralicida]|uniref:hypothetical protein n=1 Tax=Aurantimonas coralicida TaxID=182270 RepID=UPI001D193ED8|nr:hypothetical protein [Aurantimonas coralicida]MCC4298564.1 hypothetical protein [Aurantimonas coralicida]